MAGLLEGLGGDNTVKDEFGQTQADRRDPIWSGLIKAGLLAVAGGSKVMPETRAKYLAEAGGALADIPSTMIAQAGASAQQKLRGQQLDEGKRKIADRDRVRAMAQTPEFQEMIKNADGPNRLAIQAAVDTGDIAALNTAIGNLDKFGLNSEKLAIQQGRLDLAREKAENAKAGGMAGTGERQQLRTWLMTEPPDSQRYATAHNYFSKEQRYQENGVGVTQPAEDLTAQGYPAPTWAGRPGGSVGGPWPPPDAPAAGQTVTDPNTGLITETSADGKTVTTLDPKTGVKNVQAEGKVPKTEKPKPPDPESVRKLDDMKVANVKIQQAGNDFLKDWNSATPAEQANAILGRPSRVGASWANLAALVKESAVFNLGVLNGGDRDFITQALADPSSLKSLGADPATVANQVQKIFKILEVGLAEKERLTMRPWSKGGSDKPEYITGPDGKPMLKPK